MDGTLMESGCGSTAPALPDAPAAMDGGRVGSCARATTDVMMATLAIQTRAGRPAVRRTGATARADRKRQTGELVIGMRVSREVLAIRRGATACGMLMPFSLR